MEGEVTHPVPGPTIAEGRNGNERISKQFYTARGGAPKLGVFEPSDRLYVEEWGLFGREAI